MGRPLFGLLQAAVQGIGRSLVCLPLLLDSSRGSQRYELPLDALRKAAPKAKMLLFCNPHNPSGRIWRRSELEQLGAVCKAHDIVVLSDEIHSDLNFWGLPHVPFALACPSTSVVTMGAPSKTWGLAGLHCSFLVIPDGQLRARYMQIAEPAHAHFGSIFATVALQSYVLPEVRGVADLCPGIPTGECGVS
jgi:cystathionine beta-lyase